MPDSKITALASIGTGTDPANDPLVIVDVSDVSPSGMSATGTTKKVTLNNLLACSPTATLASATITGDLTVDTNVLKVDTLNNRVGIGTASPLNALQVQGTGQATVTPIVTGDQSALSLIDSGFAANNGGMITFGSNVSNGYIGQVAIKSLLVNGTQNGTSDLAFFTRGATSDSTLAERYRIAVSGVATWSNVGGVAGTAMTLNSTGLGVGVASLTNSEKLNAAGTIVSTGASLGSFGVNQGGFDYNTSTRQLRVFSGTADATGSYISFVTGVSGTINEKMRIDSSGNVGISVTTFGTSAAKVLALGTGTEPTTGPAGTVQLFTSTRSASNTIPAIFTEGSGVTNAAITNTTVTNKIAIKVNGTIYYLLATTSAA
jgi:hypothetical protein